MSGESFSIQNYLRRNLNLPFCPECGCFSVIACFLKALYNLGYKDLENFVFCSGIGCAAWIPSPYFEADSIHSTHGRSIPTATGVKLMRPDLNVVVFGGDGDIAGIGLNHLFHAARRNLDVTVVMVNNMVYGMTGGQVAPTTPLNLTTKTTPYGSFERPLDVTSLVANAGANYAARWTTFHREELVKAFGEAVSTKGFTFVEAVSQCPTMFGRRAGFKKTSEILTWFKKHTVKLKETGKREFRGGRIVVGTFVRREAPTLIESLRAVVKEDEL